MYSYKKKNVLVIGAGISGTGVARALAMKGASVTLNDYKLIEGDEAVLEELDRLCVRLISGHQEPYLLDYVHEVVLSPGIPLSIPIVEEAKKRGIPVIGEVEVAYRLSKAPILGVTGTNGKTTTTMLLGEVVKAWGKPVVVGGNIGDALSLQALETVEDGYLVAELSSYQLETIDTFHVKGAILLNITPDHLQRHKTMENYGAAKARIFENQTSDDYAVLNFDDERVRSYAPMIKGHFLKISLKGPVDQGAYYEDGILYAVKNGQREVIIKGEEIQLRGIHNIENVLTVIALCYALGMDIQIMHDAIKAFGAVEHRIEEVTTIDGVTYFNDSKATNTDSVIKALEAFDTPIVLMLGGYDKGEALDHFMKIVKERTKAVVFIGQSGKRFAQAAQKAGIEVGRIATSMEEAVAMAKEKSCEGDVVLLSPACSSFDWYSCFEERGTDFKRIVMAIKGGE